MSNLTQFSVDGISSMRNEQMERDMQEKESMMRSKQNAKTQEQIIRRIEKEKERMDKLNEQRVTRILLMKIQRRFAAFPWLQEKVPPVSPKCSLIELKETEELQKLELDLQGAEERIVSLLRQGAFMLEGIWGDGTKMTFLPEKARLDLRNFGKIVNSDMFMKEAHPLIIETTIEYPTIGQMGLPMRWAGCFLNAMIMVHQMNTNQAFRTMMEKQATQEEFVSEEDDEEDQDETKRDKKE